MMGREDEDVLVVVDLEQHSSQKQARREIELPLCFCSNPIAESPRRAQSLSANADR